MKTPIVIVNFKTYPQSVGERAVELAKTIAEVAKEKGISVAVAPQNLDLYRVASQVDIPVLAQHVDSITSGAHTGWLLAETMKATGAVGSLINHSEHQIQSEEIEQVVRRLRELELTSVVCAKDPEVCKKVAAFKPDMVAVEPPELIGTGRAVSKLKPEVVSDAVKMVREINPEVRVLCGAGITNGEDTRIALELGAEGVLLASSVVKATDPRAAMLDVAKGITK
ncbi:MAG: triose-phosphate isomerase [Hadesarchaea archaeon]|nr:triose-phosphate isomerase [Hadesarchaea archaeon]